MFLCLEMVKSLWFEFVCFTLTFMCRVQVENTDKSNVYIKQHLHEVDGMQGKLKKIFRTFDLAILIEYRTYKIEKCLCD